MSEPKISVIIPVQNEADKIEKCLEAVFSQSLKPHEVIVVDGHSTDGTVENARKFPVRIVYEDYHTRGGARQVGVENAGGEYVAFTDASCTPSKDWLQSLIQEFDANIVGVGGVTKYENDGLWGKSVNLAFSTFIGSANSIQGRYFKKKRAVRSISGGNSMYRRADIMSVGGFNPNFLSEDAELNEKLIKRGKLIYTPEAVTTRRQDRRLANFAIQIYRWGMARVATRKWALQAIPPLLVPLIFLSLIFTPWVCLILLGLYSLILIIMGVKFAIQERDIRYLISIPVVYIVEHTSYTAGFWREMIWPHRKLRKGALEEIGK